MIRGVMAALACALFATSAAAQELTLTFDDLPAHNALPPGETRLGVISSLVATLAAAGAPPSTGFVNGAGLDEAPADASVLRVWRGTGNLLGNHTWSHVNLDAVGAAAFIDEITRNEPVLRAFAGDSDWRWFRYPFLAEARESASRTAVRTALRSHDYKIASVTMDFSDWAFNEPYARCRTAGDAAALARLEVLYLSAAEDVLAASRALSNRLYGRDIPYVLLMHVGAFDAQMLPRLLKMYRERGVRLVTLAEAMDDPFYDSDLEAANAEFPLTLENAAAAKGLASPARPDLQPELAALCR